MYLVKQINADCLKYYILRLCKQICSATLLCIYGIIILCTESNLTYNK
jgi:hypothetical protein